MPGPRDVKGKDTPRISRSDFERHVRKNAKAVVGEYDISEHTAVSSSVVVPGFLQQEKEDRRKAGQFPKRKEGIWLATCDILKRKPQMSATQTWESLNGYSTRGWDIFHDTKEGAKVLCQESNAGIACILFATFRKEYFGKVKKKLAVPGD